MWLSRKRSYLPIQRLWVSLPPPSLTSKVVEFPSVQTKRLYSMVLSLSHCYSIQIALSWTSNLQSILFTSSATRGIINLKQYIFNWYICKSKAAGSVTTNENEDKSQNSSCCTYKALIDQDASYFNEFIVPNLSNNRFLYGYSLAREFLNASLLCRSGNKGFKSKFSPYFSNNLTKNIIKSQTCLSPLSLISYGGSGLLEAFCDVCCYQYTQSMLMLNWRITYVGVFLIKDCDH